MPFASWADYLCGHDGAEESNQDISSLGERFSQGAEPVENLKGEEATLFLGISADGSPLFLHHIANLGSTRRAPEPTLVALVGLQKSTIVIGLTPRDCFASIPSGGEEEDEAGEFFVPPFSKLSLSTTASAFKKASPSSKHPLSLEAPHVIDEYFLCDCRIRTWLDIGH
jgi:hypothetical protein